MTRLIAFVLLLALAQSVAPQVNAAETEATPRGIAEGWYVSPDQQMSGGTAAEEAELKATKLAYFGKPGEVCKKKSGSKCYKGGACCTGGSGCKIRYKKIKKMMGSIWGWSLVNFCS